MRVMIILFLVWSCTFLTQEKLFKFFPSVQASQSLATTEENRAYLNKKPVCFSSLVVERVRLPIRILRTSLEICKYYH